MFCISHYRLIYSISLLIRVRVHMVQIFSRSFRFRSDTSFDRLIVLITGETAAGVHSNWCTEWKYRPATVWNARNSACLLFYSLLRSFLLTNLLWSLLFLNEIVLLLLLFFSPPILRFPSAYITANIVFPRLFKHNTLNCGSTHYTFNDLPP